MSKKKSLGFYKFATGLLGGIFKVLLRVKVTGIENEKFDGSAIYCANHLSNWDPVIIACVTKRPINFIAKMELFKIPVLKNILYALGTYPIERGVNDLGAMKTTLSILKNGGSICLFPQGKRYPNREPSETLPKNGISMMAKHSKATILPIGIYTKNYKIKIFRKVYMVIGEPITFDELNIADNSREEYERVSKYIFGRICELCEQAKKGAENER